MITQKMIDTAYELLCTEDHSIEEQIKAIQEQAKVGGTLMIDHVDEVDVWAKIELEFSCDEFLEYITPHESPLDNALNNTLYSLTITFADIIANHKPLKKHFNSLSEAEQLKFINDNCHAVKSGCEYGIGHGLDEIFQTIANNIDYQK